MSALFLSVLNADCLYTWSFCVHVARTILIEGTDTAVGQLTVSVHSLTLIKWSHNIVGSDNVQYAFTSAVVDVLLS